MVRVISNSSRETKKIAGAYMREIIRGKKGPCMFLLQGDLGTGKTTFVLGALSYFGIRPHAASPTFVLAKHYKTAKKNRGEGTRQKTWDIWHVDAYRLGSKKDLDLLKLPLSDPRAIFFIEWPERVRLRSPRGSFRICFHHGSHIGERVIEIKNR